MNIMYFFGSNQKPIDLFGKDTAQHQAFLKATATICPGAAYLRNYIISLADPEALQYKAVMPDLFTLVYKVKNKEHEDKIEIDTLPKHPTFVYRRTTNEAKEDDVALCAHTTHGTDAYIVRELTARCNHNKVHLNNVAQMLIERLSVDIEISYMLPIEAITWESGICSIVGIDYITNQTVNQLSNLYCETLLKQIQRVLNHKTFPVITVHDSFHSHPNNMDRVREVYMEIIVEIAKSTLLDSMLSQITGYPITIEKMSDDLGAEIEKGTYWLS